METISTTCAATGESHAAYAQRHPNARYCPDCNKKIRVRVITIEDTPSRPKLLPPAAPLLAAGALVERSQTTFTAAVARPLENDLPLSGGSRHDYREIVSSVFSGPRQPQNNNNRYFRCFLASLLDPRRIISNILALIAALKGPRIQVWFQLVLLLQTSPVLTL